MAYRVSTAFSGGEIDFAPAAVVEEVLQNVLTLLRTVKYSVPLDRQLGIDAEFLDRPLPVVMARLRVEITEEIECFEPRAKLRVIDFERITDEETGRGKLYPIVEVDVIGV